MAAAFVAKLTGDLSQVVYSTYLGGTHAVAAQFSDGSSLSLGIGDFGHAIAVDANGDAYVVGSTGSTDFPVVDGVQPLHA